MLAAANIEVGRSSSYLLTVQNKTVHSDTTCFNKKDTVLLLPSIFMCFVWK